MNEDMLKGQWNKFRGHVREKWGKLTDDELDQIQGRKDVLIGKLQEKYGYTHERARQEVEDFISEVGPYTPSMF